MNIGYNFFVTRIDTLIVDMEQGAQEILNIAWDLEKRGNPTGHEAPGLILHPPLPLEPIRFPTVHPGNPREFASWPY